MPVRGRGPWTRVLALLLLCVLAHQAPVYALDTAVERHVGRVASAALEAETGVLDSAALEQWVGSIGGDIARVSRRGNLDFRFRILASHEVNAWALPGGHIYVCQGLLTRLRSESELAGVLGHEVAHIHDRDFQRKLTRQLVFLGVMSLLRGHDMPTLEAGLGVLHVVGTLQQSRRHEMRADAVGIDLTMQAGYDPGGVVQFLEHISGGGRERDWLTEALSTHPAPARRLEEAIPRVRAAKREDYDRLMGLADRLAGRGHSHRPLELYAVASEIRPQAAEPHLGRAEVLLRRREWEQAGAAFQAAVNLAARQSETLSLDMPKPPPARTPVARVPAAPATVQALQELEQALLAGDRESAAARRELVLHLRRARGDDRIHRALTYGQLVDARWDDLRYLGNVGAAWLMLRRCLRWPEDALELVWRESEVRGGLGRLSREARTAGPGADADQVMRVTGHLESGAGEISSQASEALQALLPHAAEVTEAAVQCSVVLLSLLGADRPGPFGELTWSRFAVNNAFLLRAARRMEHAEAALRTAREAVTGAALQTLVMDLDWEGAQAPAGAGDAVHPYALLLGARFGMTEQDFLGLWRDNEGMGVAALAAAGGLVEGEPQDVGLEARFILMRLAGNEVLTEKLPPGWACAGARPHHRQ